jgi:hypothetical protein
MTREAELESNMNKIYVIVKGQCSHSLCTVLKQEDKYKQKDKEQDILWLLEHLKSITSGLDSKSNKRCNLFDAILAFITMRQGENENDSAYMKRFKVNMETLLSAGGCHILCSPEIMNTNDSDDPTDEEVEAEENKFKAIVFLKRGDIKRYGDLVKELENSTHLGQDEYPESLAAAYDLMVRRSGAFTTNLMGNGRPRSGHNRHHRHGDGRGFNFAQKKVDKGMKNIVVHHLVQY